MKKLLATLCFLFVFLITSTPYRPTAANEIQLPLLIEYDEYAWSIPYCNEITNLGVFKDEKVDHRREIARYEFVVWLIKSMKIELMEFTNPFQDVSPSDPYFPYLMTACAKKIIPTADFFYPKKPLLRYSMGIWLINAKGAEATKQSEAYSKEPCILAQDGYDEIKAISEEACGKLTLCYQPVYQLMSYRHRDAFRMVCPMEPAVIGEACYGLFHLVKPPKPGDSIFLSTKGEPNSWYDSGGNEIYSMLTGLGGCYDEGLGSFPVLTKKIPTSENGLLQVEEQGYRPKLQMRQELRRNLKWSNGDSIDADDIIFGSYFFMHPYFSNYNRLKVEKIDDFTVRTTFSTYPLSYATEVEYIDILPKDYLEKKFNYHLEPFDLDDPNYVDSERYKNDEDFIRNVMMSDFRKYPVHAGPYQVKAWEEGKQIKMEANPNYLLGKPLIQNITILMSQPEPSEIKNVMKQNKIDLFLDSYNMNQWLNNPQEPNESFSMKWEVFPNTIWEHIEFNTDDPILHDVRVRKALTLVIDKNNLIKETGKGLFMPSKTPFLEKSFISQHMVPAHYEFDVKKAQKLMLKAGWKRNGEGFWEKDYRIFTLTFITTAQNVIREQIQELIADMWRRFGVQVETKQETASSLLYSFLPLRKFEGPTAVMFAWQINNYYGNIGSIFKTSDIPSSENDYDGQNYSAYSNPIVDELLEENLVIIDRKQAQINIAKILRLVSYEVPVIPLYFRSDIIVSRKSLKNVIARGPESPLCWNCAFWYFTEETKKDPEKEEYPKSQDWKLPVLYNIGDNGVKEEVVLSEILKREDVQYVLLDFWAFWCEPCNMMAPYLQDLYTKYKDKGLMVLSVSIDTAEKEMIISRIEGMEREDGSPVQITYPYLWDKVQTVKNGYGVTSIPVDMIINRNLEIVHSQSGFLDELAEDLDIKLAELLP